MKLILLLLFYPFLSSAQSIESRQVAGGVVLSHNIKGAYFGRVWTGDNNWFGSVGVEVLKPKDGKPFIPLMIGAGYSFGVPFIVAGAGAGFNTAGQYGALAEIGAGIRVNGIQVQVTYRGGAMNGADENGDPPKVGGWYFRLGFVF